MWALSYCKEQKAFHIGRLQNEASMNMSQVLRGITPHYNIIFVSDDKEEVHAKADELRDTLCR